MIDVRGGVFFSNLFLKINRKASVPMHFLHLLQTPSVYSPFTSKHLESINIGSNPVRRHRPGRFGSVLQKSDWMCFFFAFHIFWNLISINPGWGFQCELGCGEVRKHLYGGISVPSSCAPLLHHWQDFWRKVTHTYARAHAQIPACLILSLPDALWKPRHPSKVKHALLDGSQEGGRGVA